MFELILTIAIGLLGGIAVGTQAPISGAMSQRVGGAASSLIVHFGGAIASLILLISRGGENINQWRELPWYMLGSGGLGLVLILSISHTAPKLGATSAIALIIVGQLCAGLVIDYVGAFGTTPRDMGISQVCGAIMLLAGAYFIVR